MIHSPKVQKKRGRCISSDRFSGQLTSVNYTSTQEPGPVVLVRATALRRGSGAGVEADFSILGDSLVVA
jgi:hypothetical protein